MHGTACGNNTQQTCRVPCNANTCVAPCAAIAAAQYAAPAKTTVATVSSKISTILMIHDARGVGPRPSTKGGLNEKFNEHFRALTGLHNASNNQMLKQSCNQLPDAITRSRIFCDHLSQSAMVVSVLPGLRNARERAMYSNTVPWPMHFGQWPHSLRNHFI